jgi:hypothetical protein
MAKTYINLQKSEGYVIQAAAQIFASHVMAGTVTEANRDTIMKQSVRDALRIAVAVDDALIADSEVD